MISRVFVTGGQGLVGKALVAHMLADGQTVRASTRQISPSTDPRLEHVRITDLSSTTDWMLVLKEIDAVVHCAARVHVMHDIAANALTAFRSVNVEGTLNLARQAVTSGVKRFVFISSVKVNGEFTERDRAISEGDAPNPQDAYGQSKLEAEQGLRQIATDTGMEVVIIRPPLVYGPGVKANFLAMMRWLSKGIPLPLGAIYNQRSFVGLDNLIDLIVTCIDHPAAANQTFLVSDGEDISTTQLLRRMGRALGKPAQLLPVPVWMLEAGAALLGKRDLSQRLCGNLLVNISKARDLLGWSPPVALDEGLRRTAEYYLARLSK